ncbi:MAG: protein kinase, partial [Eubacterium sp.]|nr:protein kinase [Eubacterium sp.]
MENYVGKRLDSRYEIHEIIGVGGMSVVYKAYDNVDDRIVAVKILKEEFANDDEFVRRFKNESKAIAVLSHPNIVKVYDVSFGDKIQYIVMEYVDGITLKEYIQKQGIITWNDAVYFISQILKALQHAHDKGIVHRDIKPQNIILLSTGEIKVTDFGIARFSRTETRTLTENAIGSVHYISPEQAKGELTDERADIYSLGVVFYEMLTGTVPFEADSAVSVALMQVRDDAKRLTDINPDIPIGLEQICFHAMQKNPLERYQTATEMLLDLEEVIRNPNATFDYSYVVDKQPTKFVKREEDIKA